MSQWIFIHHSNAQLQNELRNEAKTMDASRFANCLLATHTDVVTNPQTIGYKLVIGAVYDLWVNFGKERAIIVLEQLVRTLGKSLISNAIYELGDSGLIPDVGMYDFIKQVAVKCELDEQSCLHG